ncbi:MAG: glycosyltransferase family 1 protein [Candidatus Ryanbacteria bacterium]|nr:glycosyltransferase family 1 protein [Candidatus Ryanbacteria bacterium]
MAHISNPEKKRLLFVSTKSVWGGAQKYIIDLIDYLPRDRFDIMLAAGGSGPLRTKAMERGIPFYEIGDLERNVNPLKDILAFFRLIKLFRRLKPDVIHLNSSKVSALGALAGRIAGIPTIVSSTHGWPFMEERSRWQKKTLKLLVKIGALFQDSIICVSDFDYAMGLHERIAPAHKLIRVHNGIDVKKHVFLDRQKARDVLIAKAGLHIKPSFVVGTIAEYTKNKGLVYLLEAAAHISKVDAHAVFFLIGWGEEKQFLEDEIMHRHITSNVFLIDYLPEAFTYLKALDIFVLPSIKEGFAYTLLEASLAEVPIITTRVGGNPEIVEHMKTGILVNPRSPEEIINAVSHLLRDSNDRKSFGIEARQKVIRDFSIQSMVTLTAGVYERGRTV